MGLVSEVRNRGRHALWPALGVAAIAYFINHGINGDRGLLAWRSLKQQVADERSELDRIRQERETLARRVQLLYSDSLDPDMLDEMARRLSSQGLPDEIVIYEDDASRRDDDATHR